MLIAEHWARFPFGKVVGVVVKDKFLKALLIPVAPFPLFTKFDVMCWIYKAQKKMLGLLDIWRFRMLEALRNHLIFWNTNNANDAE